MRTQLCRLGAGLLFCAVGVLVAAGSAQAQLTTELLIGDSVANADNARYSDVGEAIARYNQNDVLGARTFLERAVAKDAKLPPVDVMLAKMHLSTGKTAAGLAALDAAVRDIRTDPEPYLLLADQARGTGQSIAALALYDKGIELTNAYDANPKRKRRFIIRAYSGRAAVLQQWEDWEAAEKDLLVWKEQDPENASLLSRMGVVMFMLGKPKEGYDSFVEARKLNEDLAPPYVAAATMYQRLDKPEEARLAFERAYQENKADRSTVVAFSQWLLQTDQSDKAKALLAQAKKDLPDSFEVLLLDGLAARMSGDAAAAEQSFMQALSLSPTNRDVYNQLALMLIEQDDEEKKNRAVQFAQVNSQLNSSNSDVALTLAWCLFQVGRANEANEAYQRGLRMGRLSPDSKYIVARLMVKQNRKDVAKKLLTDADKDYPGIFVMKSQAEALLESL